jgi:hypothetical protein
LKCRYSLSLSSGVSYPPFSIAEAFRVRAFISGIESIAYEEALAEPEPQVPLFANEG